MRYLGGKARIAKRIESLILRYRGECTHYYEPFVGGANTLAFNARHFPLVTINDSHKDLMLLYAAIRDVWEPPSEVPRNLYSSLRHARSSALRGFVGFSCSFSGKWFGGFAEMGKRNKTPFPIGCKANLLALRPLLRRAWLRNGDYADLPPPERELKTLVYCDPPYDGTTGYSGAAFDTPRFWEHMQSWVRAGARVLVSEESAPANWRPIAAFDRAGFVRRDKTGDRRQEFVFVHETLAEEEGLPFAF